MHFDARVCGFCRPLTLLCWHDVSDFFSYYRLFVDDLIDTLGLKLHVYMYVHVCIHTSTYITYAYIYMYIHDMYMYVCTCMYVCMYNVCVVFADRSHSYVGTTCLSFSHIIVYSLMI